MDQKMSKELDRMNVSYKSGYVVYWGGINPCIGIITNRTKEGFGGYSPCYRIDDKHNSLNIAHLRLATEEEIKLLGDSHKILLDEEGNILGTKKVKRKGGIEYKDDFGRHVVTCEETPMDTGVGMKGRSMIMYRDIDQDQKGLYVMEKYEFHRKFKRNKKE